MAIPAASIAANTLEAASEVRLAGAKNIGGAAVAGGKREFVISSTGRTGATSVTVYKDNEAQGQTVQGSTYSLAIQGRGAIPVRTSSGDLVMTRNGTSPGLNTDGKYVLGASVGQSALLVQGWRVDSTGTLIDSTGAAITNFNDTTKLTDIDLSAYDTYSKASQNVTLNCLLDSRKAAGNNDLSQTVTFYDSIGGEHSLTVTWVKRLDGNGTYNPAGANVGGCDVWNVSITYDGGTVPKIGNSAGANYTDANCRDVYMKNGKIIGITDHGAANTLQTALGAVYIPFSAKYDPVTLDLGIGLDAASPRSVVQEAATDATLNGTADGSELSNRTGWRVQENGEVEVVFPKGSLVVYRIPIADVTSLAGVEDKGGYWIPTSASGTLQLKKAGESGAGTYEPGALEDSTIDVTQEAIDLGAIRTQEAGAALIIQSTKERDDRVINAL